MAGKKKGKKGAKKGQQEVQEMNNNVLESPIDPASDITKQDATTAPPVHNVTPLGVQGRPQPSQKQHCATDDEQEDDLLNDKMLDTMDTMDNDNGEMFEERRDQNVLNNTDSLRRQALPPSLPVNHNKENDYQMSLFEGGHCGYNGQVTATKTFTSGRGRDDNIVLQHSQMISYQGPSTSARNPRFEPVTTKDVMKVYDMTDTFYKSDQFEENRLKEIIRNKVFPKVKFCRGEGEGSLMQRHTSESDKSAKRRKISIKKSSFDKHKRIDFSDQKSIPVYVKIIYHDMKWKDHSIYEQICIWKRYADVVLKEMRNIRGKKNHSIRSSLIDGKYFLNDCDAMNRIASI